MLLRRRPSTRRRPAYTLRRYPKLVYRTQAPKKNTAHLDISNLGHPIFRCGHLNPLQICVLLQLLRLQKTKRLPGCISMGPMDIDHVRHQHANRWCGRFVSSKNMLFSGSMLDHQGVKKNTSPIVHMNPLKNQIDSIPNSY